jgi:hypothetical protein
MINVYISHPYSANPSENVEKARKIVGKIAKESIGNLVLQDMFNKEHGFPEGYNYESDEFVCPVCPLLTFPDSMSEKEGVSRLHAMGFCLSLVAACDELWICAPELTPGMREEITRASELGRPVRWMYKYSS